MKKFATLALLACVTQAQRSRRDKKDDLDQDMDVSLDQDMNLQTEAPQEPDNSQFPREWRERCSEDRKDLCLHPLEEVIKYDDGMLRDCQQFSEIGCSGDGSSTDTRTSASTSEYDLVAKYYPKRAYCKMRWNPGYTTTYPYGWYHFWQFSPASPVYIWGYMLRLPYAYKRYALTINER